MDELRNAIEINDVKKAKYLLRKMKSILNVDGQLRNKRCFHNILMIACKQGHVDMVKLLTEHQRNVNMADDNGRYPISVAVENQYMKLFRFLLLDKNANPNVRCGYDNYCGNKQKFTTPLMIASTLGNMGIVKSLIANHADVNMADETGSCPIWIAVVTKNLKLATFLLQNTNANPNVHVKPAVGYGRQLSTPLIEACKDENVDMVKLLIENNADINMADDNGVRPYQLR